MRIEMTEHANLKTDVYLMDGEKIIEYKISLSSHLVKDFIINLCIRYCLAEDGKETMINNITVNEYIRQ